MKNVMKLTLLFSLLLAIGITLLALFLLHRERADLLKAEEKRLSTAAELYASVLRNLMLSGDASLAPRITSSLKAASDFDEVDLYRTDGTPAFADYATVDFVNSRQNRVIFERSPRRAGQAASSETFKEAVREEKPRVLELGREKKLDYWFPLLNFVECRQCHGGSPFVRGVLRLTVSTEEVSGTTTRTAWAFGLAGFLLVTASALGLVFLLRSRTVRAPKAAEPETVASAAQKPESEKTEEQVRHEPIDFLESLTAQARSTAESLGKRVSLDVRTNGLFPALPEAVKEPLLAFLRNALDHGIETPEERRALGKTEEGKIELSIEGSAEAGYKITFFDDGRGLDFRLLETRARERGLLASGAAAQVPKETLLRLLFAPGLGAAETAGKPGLAAVYGLTKRESWKLLAATGKNRGTRFTLALPPKN